MMKKKNITSIVSLSKGIEVINDETITLNPSTPDIVLSGRKTLNDLRALILAPPPVITYGIKPLVTITKSKTFQASLRYEFLPRTNPKAEIFNNISKVYIP